MKKLLIGLAVVATLVIYSLGIRHEQPQVGSSTTTSDNGTSGTNSNSSSTESTNGSGSTDTSGSSSSSSNAGTYKDGTYTGSTEDAFYGDVQVKVSIQSGKIASVSFLHYPDTHSTSVEINQQAMPMLQQEAIKAQSANVNIISGATYTSEAFAKSLENALSQAA